MLFLHGLTDSGQAWPEAVSHWAGSYAIIAVDPRGHGRSPRVHRGSPGISGWRTPAT
jgi:pimeloyl-ACP methyl ester carboxylesterase